MYTHTDRDCVFNVVEVPYHVTLCSALQIRKTAQTHKLEGWEVPIAIYVEVEPFSPENGLLTLSHKLSRIPLEKKYKPVLEKLYASAIASKEKDSL